MYKLYLYVNPFFLQIPMRPVACHYTKMIYNFQQFRHFPPLPALAHYGKHGLIGDSGLLPTTLSKQAIYSAIPIDFQLVLTKACAVTGIHAYMK